MVSVIVPVYKVEKYLRRCVDSILNQTYKNLEVILVDDGSPDNCPQVCDEYVLKDSRVRVIHQQNAGQAAARNVGLRNAKGDFIAFVDADDWLEKDMYQKMYGALVNGSADIACSGCYIDENGTFTKLSINIEEFNSPETFLQGAITGQNHALIALWSKLYRRQVFDGLSFVEGITSDDCVIAIDICRKCPKLVILNEAFYHYNYDNDGSITKSKVAPKAAYGKFLWLTKWLQLPEGFHKQGVVEKAIETRLKFALRAYEMNYVKPILSEERANEIVKFLDNVTNYNDASYHRFICWCFRNCRWLVNVLAKIRYGGK